MPSVAMKAGRPKADRHHAVDGAGGEAERQADEHRFARAEPQHFQRIGGGAAGKRQHRADREVDVAGGDDVGKADRDQRELGIVEQDGERVRQDAPIVGPEVEADQPKKRR